MSVVIILTSTVFVNPIKHIYQNNKDERIRAYLTAIKQWLEKTNFKIVLVENSGYTFEELNEEKEKYKERFELFTYKEAELEESKHLVGNSSKGASEVFSISYAFHKSQFVTPSSFIIKITARYFIPSLESYLSYFDLNNYDCLTQHKRLRCEMVGCHYKHFSQVFNTSLLENSRYDCHIERVYQRRTSRYPNVLVCKQLYINKTMSGGSGFGYWTI